MIDIIFVNYNSTDHLIFCLNSIKKNLGSFSANIFIQDNASTDNAEKIKTLFPQIVFHKNSKNLGFAKAVNKAIFQGKSPYVILLNPDTYITQDFFEKCLKYMEKNLNIGLLGPKILDGDGTLQNSARSFPTPLTALFGRTSFLSRKFPNNPITKQNLPSLTSDGKTPVNVDWVSGACMVVRRKAIETTGLLDEQFFMYWEDADWCRRMKDLGWKIVYFPKAIIYHTVGASSQKRPFGAALEFHKSAYRLFVKYLKPQLKFLKPIVFIGLSVRFMLNCFFKRFKS